MDPIILKYMNLKRILLRFKKNKKDDYFPSVSLVFLTFNRLDFTKRAVLNNINNAKYPIKEIIFLDNGSNSETCEWLKNNFKEKASLYFNKKNEGIARGYNKLYSLVGDVDLIARPSSDMCMPDGWLKNMVEWHKRIDKTGIVGMISRSFLPNLSKRFIGKPIKVNKYIIQPANVLGSITFKKELIKFKLPEFGLYGYDDTIWTEMIRKAGYLNYYIEGVVQDFPEEEAQKYPEYLNWKVKQLDKLKNKKPELLKLNSIING